MTNFSKVVFLVASFFILVLLLFFLAPVLQPFYLAMIFAYLSNPVVDKLQEIKIPRILAVIIVFVIILSLLALLSLFLIPLLIDQINLLLHKLPLLIDWIQIKAIPWINHLLGGGSQFNMEQLKVTVMSELKNNQNMIAKIVATITSSSFSIIIGIFQLLLIPIVTFYLLRDWHVLLENMRKVIPRSIEPTVVLLFSKYDAVLRAFLKGQLLVMLILGCIYTIGLWIVGLQFAILIGVSAGLLNIVPYLGFSVGLISALFAAYYQYQSLLSLLSVSIVFLLGQSIESTLLTPILVGDSIGLHPVAVIFAVLTGGYFFGIIGALIALPTAAAIMVLARFGLQKYYSSPLYY